MVWRFIPAVFSTVLFATSMAACGDPHDGEDFTSTGFGTHTAAPVAEGPKPRPIPSLNGEIEARAETRYAALRGELIARYEATSSQARAADAEGVQSSAGAMLEAVHRRLEAASLLARRNEWADAVVELERGRHGVALAETELEARLELVLARVAAPQARPKLQSLDPATRSRPQSSGDHPVASSKVPTLAELYDRLAPSVVAIEIRDDRQRRLATGSGFFVSDDGLIITNHHVVEDASVAVVRTHSGRLLAVDQILHAAPHLDLALLKVDVDGHPFLPISTEGTPAVGQSVLTIGNPKGLSGSLSRGIVSGLRQMSSGAEVIQMTAPISPGSSGGPVISPRGDVVGVAYATVRDSQGINLAVAASAVRAFLRQPRSAVGLHAPGPKPDLYAAILWCKRTGRYSYSYDALSKGKAIHAARRSLGGGSDRVATWTRNGWCAIAFGADAGAWGAASGRTRMEAEQRALEACAKNTSNCYIGVAIPADGSLLR